jgi:hypothetical protein
MRIDQPHAHRDAFRQSQFDSGLPCALAQPAGRPSS